SSWIALRATQDVSGAGARAGTGVHAGARTGCPAASEHRAATAAKPVRICALLAGRGWSRGQCRRHFGLTRGTGNPSRAALRPVASERTFPHIRPRASEPPLARNARSHHRGSARRLAAGGSLPVLGQAETSAPGTRDRDPRRV